jgi:hypothetical protein
VSATWRDGSWGQSNWGFDVVTSGFVGTRLGTWKAGTFDGYENNVNFTASVTNSTFYPAIAVSFSSASANAAKQNTWSFAGTARSITTSTSATGTATSTANTALTAPTTGDICMLIEEVDAVTATLNTAGNDLRCAISRNGGTGWDYVTLVDKGSWGTNKKILVANGVPFSNSVSGTDMRYKLEWANQVAATAGTSGLLDISGTSKTVTNNGVTQSSAITPKWGTKSLYFDGSSDYLTTPDHADWDLTGTDSTHEFWVYFSSLPAATYDFFSTYAGSGTDNSRIYIETTAGTAKLKFGKNGVNEQSSAGGVVSTGSWYHLAFVRHGSSNYIYKDGVSLALSANVDWTHNSPNPLTIGGSTGVSRWFDGYMQDIRISNTARYPSGTTFAVPTAAFPTDSNTKLLISGNDGADVAGHQVKVHATSLAWA